MDISHSKAKNRKMLASVRQVHQEAMRRRIAGWCFCKPLRTGGQPLDLVLQHQINFDVTGSPSST
jgi:hypothetical protein